MSKVLRNVVAVQLYRVSERLNDYDLHCVLFEYDERLRNRLLRLMNLASIIHESDTSLRTLEFEDLSCLIATDQLDNAELTRQFDNDSAAYLANLTVYDNQLVDVESVNLRVHTNDVTWQVIARGSELWESMELSRGDAANLLSPARVIADRWKDNADEVRAPQRRRE